MVIDFGELNNKLVRQGDYLSYKDSVKLEKLQRWMRKDTADFMFEERREEYRKIGFTDEQIDNLIQTLLGK